MEDGIDLKKILKNISLNIYYLIALFVILFCIFAYFYVSVERIYKVTSLIKVDDEAAEFALDLTSSLGNSNTNLEQEIILYSSKSNMQKVVKDLNLDVGIYLDNSSISTLDKAYFQNYRFDFDPINPTSYSFFIERNASSFNIYDEDESLMYSEIKFGEKVDVGDGSFVLTKLDIAIGEIVNVIFYDESLTIDYYAGSIYLSVVIDSNFAWEKGNLLNVSYNTTDVNFGKKILNKANEVFVNQDIESKSLEANKSIEFLDKQLEVAKLQLEKSELLLSNFQQEFGTVNVNLEIEGYIDEIALLNEKIRALRINRVELESKYSADNVAIQSLKSQEKELINQLDFVRSQISKLPETQQEYVNLFGDVEINKLFYQELMSKKLEVSIIKASTLGRVQIIDEAYLVGKVSPSGRDFLVILVALYSLLAALIIGIRSYFFNYLKFPSAVVDADQSLAISGVVPLFQENDNEENMLQYFESTLGNILVDLKNSESKILQITGPTQGVGKSTIAKNVAVSLSSLKKKVVLIDFDYKKGKLHRQFNVEPLANMDTFEKEFEISKFKISEYLSFIPRKKSGAKDFMPFIESNLANIFFQKLRNEFDYIVLDTPPILNLIDALAVSQHTDLLYFVCRHNMTTEKELRAAAQVLDSINKKPDGVVYNAYKEEFGNYYYYSEYDYKYNYGYNYKYYEADKDG